MRARIDKNPSAGKRIIFASVGLIATLLAVLGAWLPVLPTTPFVLIALWAFTRSSEKLSTWLRRIPVLKGALRAADDYHRERTLPLGMKIFAQTMAWASTGVIAFTTQSWWLSLIAGIAALGSTVFMARTPSRPRPSADIGNASRSPLKPCD